MSDGYTQVFNQSCFDANQKIVARFELLSDNDFKAKTHLFNGRYENLYIEVEKLPELEFIINTAKENAANILKIDQSKLAYGFWLNEMQPGHVTTAHTHDDDDELLSCVYYIKVPEHSGNLIITENNEKTIITPKEGMFIFFSPATLHEVSENKSEESRLSIAFNFGPQTSG